MDPFVGEIRIMATNFAPKGWALCQGQLLSIQANTALYSLLGTTYGGDGRATFGLPNLIDSIPIGVGQGPGLSDYQLGEQIGSPTVTLISSEMPSHNHAFVAANDIATTASADGNLLANISAGGTKAASYVGQTYSPSGPTTQLAVGAMAPQGGAQPHENRMPFLALTYVIALQGVFPQRQAYVPPTPIRVKPKVTNPPVRKRR